MTSNKFETYLFTYRHEGKEWCFEIQATDPQDAQARVAKLSMARYDGCLVFSIPVPEPSMSRVIKQGIRLFQRLVNGRPKTQFLQATKRDP